MKPALAHAPGLALVFAVAFASRAEAATLLVPQGFATIQEAVDAAAPGDLIRVGPGRWVGATVSMQLTLRGEAATIIGDPASPFPSAAPLRAGFFLPDAEASGTTIEGFTFDGAGISNSNFEPLAFAVFARDADRVTVTHNRIIGTIQAITNTRGDGWEVSHNQIEGLTALTCDGFCGGGDGIVFQARPLGAAAVAGNVAAHNLITGAVPDTLDEFSMVGILVIGGDGTQIRNNRIAIPDNPAADGAGIGTIITNLCCGEPSPVSAASKSSTVVNNDGRGSEVALEIDAGNESGSTLRGNLGRNRIGSAESAVKNRSRRTFLAVP